MPTPKLSRYNGPTKLVMAFDIGATFSSISYCILEQGEVPEIWPVSKFCGINNDNVYQNDPQSQLYYDRSGNVRAAGAEVLTGSVIEIALREGWTKAEWWKLHLRPEYLASSINKDNDLPPLPPAKRAVDILGDFIKYLFESAKASIQERHTIFSWSDHEGHIEYIFTYPNGWEGVPQQLYRRAIERAGLIPSTPEGQARVHLLTEGEANLHWHLGLTDPSEEKIDYEATDSPQRVVVVDAGGATINLSMFSVTTDPISCEEIAPAECRLQGSVFVTRRARLLLEKKLEGWEHATSDEIAEYSHEFDQTTKLVITNDQVPAYVKVAGLKTSLPKYHIHFGKLKLTGKEATSLIDKSFAAIIEAFEQQQKFATTPTTVCFVGGFSENSWLWYRLQSYFREKKIPICRPYCDKSVAHGAVLAHIDRENHLVHSRVARITYGVICALPVNENDAEHLHRKHQWERDPTGKYYVPGHFEVKLSKGNQICEEMIFWDSLSLTEPNLAEFGFQSIRLVYYWGSSSKPKWVDQASFFTFCTIYVDLREPARDLVPERKPSGEIYYQLDYDVTIFLGLTELKAQLGWRTREGERRIPAIVSFPEDDERDLALARATKQPRKTSKEDRTITSLTAEVVGVRNASVTMAQQVATLREDNLKLRDSISVYSSRIDELERSQRVLSVDLDSARHELEVKMSLVEERDRTITSLKECDVERTKQFGTLRRDYARLQRDASSQKADFQKRCDAQSKEHDSIRHALQESKALVEEKDRTIVALNNEVEKWKRVDTIKTEQLYDERQDKEKFQESLAASSTQIASLQERCNAQDEEILSLRNGLQSHVSLPVEEKCIGMLEGLGNAALSSGKHDKAIACYSSALLLGPSNPVEILVKRSKARALKGLWEDALTDANEVIKLNPSSHRGYERKYIALHGLGNYVDANNVILRMLSIIEESPDEEIHRLRKNYITPCEALNAIDAAIREIFNLCPLVLIDLETGRLCDAHERIRMFKSETQFKKLVSEAVTTKLDYPRIRQAVAKYFKWIMLSHTWEGKEPTFQDVNLVESVWKLDKSLLSEKLQRFCRTAREDGHRWAWSDTCCIDKGTSAILSQSLTSMYSWYEEAAETLVYLADVLSSSALGDLTKSRWMTRAWTLQELLASGVIRFYTRDWKPYLNDTHRNHKDSPTIKQELAQAMGVAPDMIAGFRPENLGVREKLRLASTRNATVEEDIAYSLIGIFSSDIAPRYGLGKTALGHLLENIIARTGDVTVLTWTGRSLPYNSALPDSLTVYGQAPYSPPPMETDELEAGVERLRTGLASRDHTLTFYNQVVQLSRATFWNRCLQLPCIVFRVARIDAVQGSDDQQGTLYRATVPLLGKVPVEFRTTDAMLAKMPKKLVFVHPWLRDLRDPLDEFVSDDEDDEDDVEADVDDDGLGDGTDGTDESASDTSSYAKSFTRVDRRYRQALRLIVRVGRPFSALLLERHHHNQYKRVATDCEIIIPGVPYQTNPKDLQAKVLEIV